MREESETMNKEKTKNQKRVFLTEMVRKGGCAAKIPPQDLCQILQGVWQKPFPKEKDYHDTEKRAIKNTIPLNKQLE